MQNKANQRPRAPSSTWSAPEEEKNVQENDEKHSSLTAHMHLLRCCRTAPRRGEEEVKMYYLK